MSMTSLRRYTASDRALWDAFVAKSKNGTFLFLRDYMDYHADRFVDHSLLFFDSHDRLLGVMPANEHERTLYSHQGLTYGGLVVGKDVTATQVLKMFDSLVEYLREQGLVRLIYKQVPVCYHLCPAQEDEYALWRHGASVQSCLISTTIPLKSVELPSVERRRLRGMRKAQSLGAVVRGGARLQDFWPIMEQNLRERYGVAPVHSCAEMQLLRDRFPENIECFLVTVGEETLAGAVVYRMRNVVHVQYGHATPKGKECGALDLLYLQLIERYRSEGLEYFDFGNSNEQGGWVLNENLIAQKEGFGGRAIVYKTYCIML